MPDRKRYLLIQSHALVPCDVFPYGQLEGRCLRRSSPVSGVGDNADPTTQVSNRFEALELTAYHRDASRGSTTSGYSSIVVLCFLFSNCRSTA